jgi:hypothetical protein
VLVTAGPVPAIVVPLTLAALLTTAKSETSIRVARKMLVVIRLLFIRFAFLDILRLKKSKSGVVVKSCLLLSKRHVRIHVLQVLVIKLQVNSGRVYVGVS